MRGWNMTPGKFQVDLMTGLDFGGKTVGLVCFETVGIVNQYKWIILMIVLMIISF